MKPFALQNPFHISQAARYYASALTRRAISTSPLSGAPSFSGRLQPRPQFLSKNSCRWDNTFFCEMSTGPLLDVGNKVLLSSKVEAVRRLLLDVTALGEEQGQWESLEVRFAGGWVRDLILQIPSHDIDVALSSTTGAIFAKFLHQFLCQCQDLSAYGLSSSDLGRIYIVAANPEKSKQLETASLQLKGQELDLDFVNLRREVYDPQSRTPRMEFGTAREDALRRDATINALFYNLHTQMIEDLTTGVQDMHNRIIRTPTDPLQTFMDDPLRILRLIRFASRLDFTIDPATRRWMGDEKVVHEFMAKISRERVDQEITKMFKDVAPKRALVLIDDLGLYPTIFTTTDSTLRQNVKTTTWSNSYNCLECLLSNASPKSLRTQLIYSDKEVGLSWLLACLTPLAQIPLPENLANSKVQEPYATQVTRQGVKQDNKVCALVTGASRHLEEIIGFKNSFMAGETYATAQDKLGMAIRRWQEHGGQWKLQIVFAILVEALGKGATEHGRKELLADWQAFVDGIEEVGLMDAASRKPIIDGKVLQRELGIKAGKWMKDALDVCMAWQFRQMPEEVDIDGAIEEVRSKSKMLGISLSTTQE